MSLGKNIGKAPRKHGAPGRPSPEKPEVKRPRVESPKGSLGQQLDRWLPTWEESRDADPMVIHASNLADLCTRQRALVSVGRYDESRTRELVPTALRVRFDVGVAAHDLVRDKYLGPMGLLYGDWKHACGNRAVGTKPPTCFGADVKMAPCDGHPDAIVLPVLCSRHEEPWTYVEREVDKEVAGVRVVGHLDGMEMDPRLGAGVLEIKSTESAVFNKVPLPLKQHVFTLKVYLWITGFKWGRILYCSTGLEKKSPFKDFVIKYDMRVAAQIERTLRDVASGGTKKCRAANDARAIGCLARKQCWGLA